MKDYEKEINELRQQLKEANEDILVLIETVNLQHSQIVSAEKRGIEKSSQEITQLKLTIEKMAAALKQIHNHMLDANCYPDSPVRYNPEPVLQVLTLARSLGLGKEKV